MSNQLTILEEINKLLRGTRGELDAVAASIVKISKEARGAKGAFNFSTPNEVNQRIQQTSKFTEQVNAHLKEQDRLERALITQIARKEIALESTNRALAKQRFETKEINKNVAEEAVLNSKLSTFYQKQNVILNRLTRRLQSLNAKKNLGIKLSKEEARELNILTKSQSKLDAALKKSDAQVGRNFRNVGNYGKALGGLTGVIRTLVPALGILGAIQLGKSIFAEIKEIDGLNKALLQVTESQERFNAEQRFLIDLSDEAGVEINGLQKSYTKFLAASKTTNLTIAETRNIFRQTAKAGAVLGLSTDDLNGSFRALEQILSKGKVQAEEIRGQLGERLPGAFQILAQSMGLTTAELSKQLELGNVISEEVLPKFAEELEKVYGLNQVKKVDTLIAAQNRLSNEWNLFIRSVENGDGVISQTFKTIITEISETIKWWRKLNDVVGGVDGGGYRRELEEIAKQSQRTGEAEQEIAKRRLTTRENTLKSLEGQLDAQREAVKLAKAETNFLERGAGISKASKNFESEKEKLINLQKRIALTKGQIQAIKELTDETDKNNNSKKEGSKQLAKQIGIFEDIRKAAEDVKLQFNDLFQAGIIDLETYNRALNNIETAITNITEGLGAIELLDDPLEGLVGAGAERLAGGIQDLSDDLKNLPWEEALQKAGEFFDELGNLSSVFFDRKIQQYEDDINRNDLYYAQLLDNESLSQEQRLALEAEQERRRLELEKRKREEQKKQAIVAKAFAATQIIINTAVAVSKTLAELGIFGIPLKTLIIAEGALALAAVIAQPIPQFAEGKDERDPYTGAMIWGEKQPEVKVSKRGDVSIATKPTLGYTEKGDTIYPSIADYQADVYRQSVSLQVTDQNERLNTYQKDSVAIEIKQVIKQGSKTCNKQQY